MQADYYMSVFPCGGRSPYGEPRFPPSHLTLGSLLQGAFFSRFKSCPAAKKVVQEKCQAKHLCVCVHVRTRMCYLLFLRPNNLGIKIAIYLCVVFVLFSQSWYV